MVLGPIDGRAMLDRLERRAFGWAAWDALGQVRPIDEPDGEHLELVLATVDVEAIRAPKFAVALDACHGAGGRLGEALLRALGCDRRSSSAPIPDGRYDHPPEPTAANLEAFSAIVPRLGRGGRLRAGPRRRPPGDRRRDRPLHRRGADPGPGRLAPARPGDRAGRPEPLDLAGDRGPRRPVRLPGDPDAGRRDPRRRGGCGPHSAVLGGEGNGGVIDPRVGFVRDSFVGDGPGPRPPGRIGPDRSRAWSTPCPDTRWSRTSIPGANVPTRAGLFDRIAEAHPEAKADRRDGLRLDWPDRWAHVRSSNTEPIVRVIAEAADAAAARALADADRAPGRRREAARERPWPTFDVAAGRRLHRR